MLPSPHLAPIVNAAADNLSRQRSPAAQRAIVERVAHEAYRLSAHELLMSLRTQEQVAAELGVDASVISRRARARGIGWQVGRLTRLYRPEDIEALRPSR